MCKHWKLGGGTCDQEPLWLNPPRPSESNDATKSSTLERGVVGVNLGGVSARIYALSALDQVDLASWTPSYLECHVPLAVAMAMSK